MLRVLIVDDEALARSRLRTLVKRCGQPPAAVLAEAGSVAQAMDLLNRQPFDVALLDIHMPGADGLQMARQLAELPVAPQVVFVTAHPEHAVSAFELDVCDYLTKPVRLERLEHALQKVERVLQTRKVQHDELAAGGDWIVIVERGRTLRLPLQDVLYFKAELKYITVRTVEHHYLLDGSLNHLEERYPGRFMRVHRNALVAPKAIRALERGIDSDDGESWAVRLTGVDDAIAVSRRQVASVRALLVSAEQQRQQQG
ncbi:MAG: LytTR family DNA-binding domain-containing protein [Burkholderiaceae bacterium]|jgi:two-component system response regulator AlgR|nr:LytTR family DNA-binding domain-containing protein [Burkholderiaceae bacterium]